MADAANQAQNLSVKRRLSCRYCWFFFAIQIQTEPENILKTLEFVTHTHTHTVLGSNDVTTVHI